MDATKIPAKNPSKREALRNRNAWSILTAGSGTCRFYPHGFEDHEVASAQPHFYRPATAEERRNHKMALYHFELKDGSMVIAKRIPAGHRAEVIEARCRQCAADWGTGMVMCFQDPSIIGPLADPENRRAKR